jgi:hypothetical protein
MLERAVKQRAARTILDDAGEDALTHAWTAAEWPMGPHAAWFPPANQHKPASERPARPSVISFASGKVSSKQRGGDIKRRR